VSVPSRSSGTRKWRGSVPVGMPLRDFTLKIGRFLTPPDPVSTMNWSLPEG
jgi:hypothetical protein